MFPSVRLRERVLKPTGPSYRMGVALKMGVACECVVGVAHLSSALTHFVPSARTRLAVFSYAKEISNHHTHSHATPTQRLTCTRYTAGNNYVKVYN